MEVINSLKNEYIQIARELNCLKGRNLNNKILLEGEEIIAWAINYDLTIDFIITSRDDITHITTQLKSKVATFRTTEGLMKKITDTKYLVPVIAVGRIKNVNKVDDFILVMDDLKDFGNIGTIIRTINAFGIKKVISTKKDFDLYQKKTIDASRGTVFKTEYNCFSSPEETIKYLRDNNYQIVTTSPYGREIQSLVNLTNKPIALVVGNETNGASDLFIENSDVIIQIPMQENVESLNVGVATGISVYELKLKQVIKMIEDRIKTTLGRELNVASMLMLEALDKAIKKVSFLSSHQLVFMMVLKCDTKMSREEIMKQFGIIDSEFDSFAQPLINNLFIMDTPDGDYAITEKGVETLGKLWTIVQNTENAILLGFTEDEKDNLFKMLERIKSNSMSLL